MKSPRRLNTVEFAAAVILSALLPACAALAQGQKPSPAAGREGPFRGREVEKKAVVTAPAPPPQGDEARAEEDEEAQTGVVRLRAILSADGKVTNITVLKGLPGGLTEKAVAAARQIKFKPAEKDGRPVSQWVTLEYNFNVYYEEDDAEITKKVLIKEQPRPAYTAEALRERVAGRVVIEAYFGRNGKVSRPRVVEGLPHGLSEQAVEAARRIRFEPAEVKGERVTVLRRVEYVFSPDEAAPAGP